MDVIRELAFIPMSPMTIEEQICKAIEASITNAKVDASDSNSRSNLDLRESKSKV